jgi:hypothetical protein
MNLNIYLIKPLEYASFNKRTTNVMQDTNKINQVNLKGNKIRL